MGEGDRGGEVSGTLLATTFPRAHPGRGDPSGKVVESLRRPPRRGGVEESAEEIPPAQIPPQVPQAIRSFRTSRFRMGKLPPVNHFGGFPQIPQRLLRLLLGMLYSSLL